MPESRRVSCGLCGTSNVTGAEGEEYLPPGWALAGDDFEDADGAVDACFCPSCAPDALCRATAHAAWRGRFETEIADARAALRARMDDWYDENPEPPRVKLPARKC